MGRLITSGLFISLILSAFSAGVSAQTFNDEFDTGNLGDWLLAPDPLTTASGPTFNMDGNPAVVAGTGLPFSTGGGSLNYNDGMDYSTDLNTGGGSGVSGTTGQPGNYGFALYPSGAGGGFIDLSSFISPELSFWCNYDTEIEDNFDIRNILLFDSAGTTFLLYRQFLPQGSAGAPAYFTDYETCSGAPGSGHWHTMALDPTWGSIAIMFEFDTMDDLDNSGAGWFIDSLTIGEVGSGGGTGGGGGTVADSVLYRPHAGGKDSDGRGYQGGGCSGFIARSESMSLVSLGTFFGSLLLLVVVGRRFRV